MTSFSWRVLAIVLGLIVGELSGTESTFARDRPGTPNKLDVFDCSNGSRADICVSFENTASEEVKFEIWANVSLKDPREQKIQCVAMGHLGGCMDPTMHFAKKGPLSFRVVNVEYEKQYCFRLRARRVDNDVASEAWSNLACGNTRKAPIAPSKPNISTSYLGTQWLNNPRRQVPEKLVVAIPASKSGQEGDFSLLFDKSPARLVSAVGQVSRWELPITANMDNVSIKLCLKNPSGEACTEEVVSVQQQRVLRRNGGNVIDMRPGQEPAPARLAQWVGRWDTRTDAGGHYEIVFRLDGQQLAGAFRNLNGSSQYDGTITGKPSINGMIYEYTQPNVSAKGKGIFILDQDGNKITGSGIVDDAAKTKFRWWGSKVGPNAKLN